MEVYGEYTLFSNSLTDSDMLTLKLEIYDLNCLKTKSLAHFWLNILQNAFFIRITATKPLTYK